MSNFAITFHRVEESVITEFSVKAVADTYEEAKAKLWEIADRENEQVKTAGGKVHWDMAPSGTAFYKVRRHCTEWLEIKSIG